MALGLGAQAAFNDVDRMLEEGCAAAERLPEA